MLLDHGDAVDIAHLKQLFRRSRRAKRNKQAVVASHRCGGDAGCRALIGSSKVGIALGNKDRAHRKHRDAVYKERAVFPSLYGAKADAESCAVLNVTLAPEVDCQAVEILHSLPLWPPIERIVDLYAALALGKTCVVYLSCRGNESCHRANRGGITDKIKLYSKADRAILMCLGEVNTVDYCA